MCVKDESEKKLGMPKRDIIYIYIYTHTNTHKYCVSVGACMCVKDESERRRGMPKRNGITASIENERLMCCSLIFQVQTNADGRLYSKSIITNVVCDEGYTNKKPKKVTWSDLLVAGHTPCFTNVIFMCVFVGVYARASQISYYV
jgi:hypothetical protein